MSNYVRALALLCQTIMALLCSLIHESACAFPIPWLEHTLQCVLVGQVLSLHRNLVIGYVHYLGFVDWIECAHCQHLGQLQQEWWNIVVHWDLVTAYPAVLKSRGRVCIMTLPRMTKCFNCGFYYYNYTLVELIFKETRAKRNIRK